jgi:hypothetical protein
MKSGLTGSGRKLAGLVMLWQVPSFPSIALLCLGVYVHGPFLVEMPRRLSWQGLVLGAGTGLIRPLKFKTMPLTT